MIRNQRGQAMLEYVLIVVFVVVAGLVVWKAFGKTVAEKVQSAQEQIDDAEPARVRAK